MTRLLALLGLLFFPVVLLAPSAGADGYTDALSLKFNATTHVVADPAATPPLPNPAVINTQILASGKPIYVAVVAPAETGIVTPDTLHAALVVRIHNFSGVLLVMDTKGYHTRAFNVPQSIAAIADSAMSDAAKAHHNDPQGAISAYVSRLGGVNAPVGAPVSSSPGGSAAHHSLTWLWVLLGIVGGIVALGLSVWAWMGWRGRADDRASQSATVREGLIDVEPDITDLENATVAGDDVSTHAVKARSAYSAAEKAMRSGDLSSAQAYLRNARKAAQSGHAALNPLDVDKVTATPPQDRKKATVAVKSPTGQNVVINNNNYRRAESGAYPYYYGGGMYNGMYFYPGYYPYAFYTWGWSPTDVLLTDALLRDRWDGDYTAAAPGGDADFDGSSQAASDWNTDSNWTTPAADSNGGGYDSSGTDTGYDGSSREDTSYSTPSYSSSSSSDSGGGSSSYDSGSSSYDSSGSSSDFGGGGDSGGGFSSGGGDSGF